jgi:Homing endonuclease associated repeat
MASGGIVRTSDEGLPGSPAWWTGDRIVAAIQAWAQRTGEPPTAREWKRPPSSPVNAGEGVPTGNSRPTTRRVIRVFGSWSEAIEAAGSLRAPRGGSAAGDSRRRLLGPARRMTSSRAYALPIASSELSRAARARLVLGRAVGVVRGGSGRSFQPRGGSTTPRRQAPGTSVPAVAGPPGARERGCRGARGFRRGWKGRSPATGRVAFALRRDESPR